MAVGDKYGCCPETYAVCCPDKIHCCPEGYSCTDGKCVLGKSLHPLLDLKVHEQEPPVLDVKCPDNYTCYPNGADSYGCCPTQNAVCCADMKHCCPTDYYCDPTNGQCTDSRSHLPLIELVSRPLQSFCHLVFSKPHPSTSQNFSHSPGFLFPYLTLSLA